MVRYQWLREARFVDELGDRLAIQGHSPEQTQPGRIGQRLEDSGHGIGTGRLHVDWCTSMWAPADYTGYKHMSIRLYQRTLVYYSLVPDAFDQVRATFSELTAYQPTPDTVPLRGDVRRRSAKPGA